MSELGACEEVIDSIINHQKYLTWRGLSMSESVLYLIYETCSSNNL